MATLRKVYLVCGVPASGKSWVCNQLTATYAYIRHDDHYRNYASAILNAADKTTKPLLCDCPFAERPLKQRLESLGFEVIPLFIVESPEVIKERYERRNKPVPQANLTRANSIADRAKEWNAFSGTSKDVLAHMIGLVANGQA